MKAIPRQIPPGGVTLAGEDPATALELGDEEDIRVAGPLRWELRLQRVGHELIASGSVRATLSLLCVRCAAWFECEASEPQFLCSIPFENEDESVDLTPEMRESIILALPSYPVCKSDCAGLCPRCGADLNKGACGCPAPVARGWECLKDLKLKP